MTIAISVGPGVGSGFGDQDSTTLNGVAAGDTLVSQAIWFDPSTPVNTINVTASSESNLTLRGKVGPQNPSTTSLQSAYLSNVVNSGNKTVAWFLTASVGGSGVMYAVALSGCDTTGAFDAEASGTGTSSTPSISITTTTDNCAIFAICISTDSDPTPTGGATQITLPNVHWSENASYLLDAGSAGSKTVGFSTSGSGTWSIIAIAIKAAGGGGGAAGQPTTKRFGGVPHALGRKRFGSGSGGGVWGQRDSGLIVPKWAA